MAQACGAVRTLFAAGAINVASLKSWSIASGLALARAPDARLKKSLQKLKNREGWQWNHWCVERPCL